MKKSLIFAMAMALGVTASAYAANPFSDVPAGHWAYDSIEKLAAAGVIDGYGDGTFGGDKLMTRYEMAQIVARAMANGANVDKLAAEFADELDALGVRVANLEKKADAVKITGQIRLHNQSFHGLSIVDENKLRSRLFFKGQVNDDWTYTGMIENIQDFKSETGDEGTDFQRAFVNGKLGGVAIEAGRNHLVLLGNGGQIYGNRADYVKASYGKDIKLTGYIGKFANKTTTTKPLPYGEDFWAASVSGKIGVVNAEAMYVDVESQANDGATNRGDNNIVGIDVKFPIVKDLTLEGLWMKAKEDDADGNDQSVFAMLKYKGAKANKPGSWGVYAKYYNMAGSTIIQNGEDNTIPNKFLANGFTGYAIGAEYAVAKNMVALVDWADLEDKKDDSKEGAALWSQLVITF